jgi:hypothetical protein
MQGGEALNDDRGLFGVFLNVFERDNFSRVSVSVDTVGVHYE